MRYAALDRYSGSWDSSTIQHLWRRAAFGASRETVERSQKTGLEATLDDLFERRASHPELSGGIRSLLGTGDVSLLQSWWMSLILADHAPLVERVALMWHDHFATSNAKVNDVRLMHRQNEILRSHGLGDFRVLVRELAKDPAMLRWLDGNENRVGRPNENFAREVMELFCLGIGNYSEDDVREAARAFTGWGTHGRRFVFREADHDRGAKTILGKRGKYGAEDALELILGHPACARHVAKRLLDEFVGPGPLDSDVTALASQLVRNDWRIDSTLRALLSSRIFFEKQHQRSKIAGPVELIAISVHQLEATVSPKRAARAASDMGQSLFLPPSVKGWDGGRTWIDAGSWIQRHNVMARLAFESSADGARTNLAQSLGSKHPEEVVGSALEILLSGTDARSLRPILEDAVGASASHDNALADVTALILTSPEYSLV